MAAADLVVLKVSLSGTATTTEVGAGEGGENAEVGNFARVIAHDLLVRGVEAVAAVLNCTR